MSDKMIEDFKKSNSQPIQNIPKIAAWFNCYDENDDYAFEVRKILQNNKKIFTDKYGEQNFCLKDSAKRQLYVWLFNATPELRIWVITAPERGTSIEYSYDSIINRKAISLIKTHIRDIFELKQM